MQRTRVFAALALAGCTPIDIALNDTKNLDPAATISSPIADTVFYANEVVEFLGTVSDGNGAEDIQTVSWTSDVDGELGTPELIRPDGEGNTRFSAILSSGAHLITLTVTDRDGATARATVNIAVGISDPEPVVEITEPENFAVRYAGTPVTFVGTVEDPQYLPETVVTFWTIEEQTSHAVVFTDEMQTTAEGETTTTWDNPVIGQYVITLEGQNEAGYAGEHAITIEIGDPNDVDGDGDGYTPNQLDCDDDDPYTYPGAVELEDGKDNDCDGDVDEGTDLYDDDGDGYCESEVTPCSDGALNGDCNDLLDYVNPSEDEVCGDLTDNDCDGSVDVEDSIGCQDYYYDYDADGYGTEDVEPKRCLCSSDAEWIAKQDGDCNDYDNLINPGAVEIADRLDNNCNALKDETTDWYDDDGDGFCESTVDTCTVQGWQSLPWPGGDCDDLADDINPDEVETCSTTWDDNCDGDTNDVNATGCTTYYADGDNDAYADMNNKQCTCSSVGDYKITTAPTSADHDCHDGHPDVHPYQYSYFNQAYSTLTGGTSFDYNCNGSEEKYDNRSGHADGCSFDWFSCDGNDGWSSGSTSPSCGASNTYMASCTDDVILGLDCEYATQQAVTQTCR